VKKVETQKVHLVLSIPQYEACKRIAKKQRRSISSVIREAVEELTGVKDVIEQGGYFERHEDGK